MQLLPLIAILRLGILREELETRWFIEEGLLTDLLHHFLSARARALHSAITGNVFPAGPALSVSDVVAHCLSFKTDHDLIQESSSLENRDTGSLL